MAKVKTGGRKKGTPNKTTREIRVVLNKFLEQEIFNLPKLIEQLDPKDKAALIVKLLPYALPKLNPIDQSQIINKNDCKELNINSVLVSLSHYRNMESASISLGVSKIELMEFIIANNLESICKEFKLPPYNLK